MKQGPKTGLGADLQGAQSHRGGAIASSPLGLGLGQLQDTLQEAYSNQVKEWGKKHKEQMQRSREL